MHRFPPSERLQFLLGNEARLTQIVINPYGLVLVLDNDCSVSIEGGLSYRTPDGSEITYSAEWRNELPIAFHATIERRLIAVTSEEWRMSLAFDDGAMFVVHSDESGYEAGQIAGDPSGALIVF